ncbi:MAG: glycerol-3-phosphate 1-O-acyltransferase PlsY [Bryobacteraceae bacterium]
MTNGLVALALAYLVGAIPFGYLLVKWTKGTDVRSSGSGNIGATNVLRTAGRAAGAATLLLDGGKGYLAVWLAARLSGGSAAWTAAAALAVMAGHAYPVFLRFRGGKAVASCVGAFLYLEPLPLAAVLVVWIVIVAVTRYVSLGSVVAAATLPLAVWLIAHPPAAVTGAAAAAGAFIVWRHQSNLQRLREGSEHKLNSGGSRR